MPVPASLDPDRREGLETSSQIASAITYGTSRYQSQVFGPLLPILHRTASILEGSGIASAHGAPGPDYSKLIRVAEKLVDCCKTPTISFDESAVEFHVHEYRCRSRLCPRCAITRAETLRASLRPMIQTMNSPRLLTLTLKATEDPLRQQIQHLVHSFGRLRRTKEWRYKMRGGVYTVEVTFNKKTELWHPHLHAVVDGSYIPQKKLVSLWQVASNGSRIVDIRMCHDRSQAAAYVTKYITKTNDASRIPDYKLAEWATAIKGQRFVSTFGSMRGIKLTDDEEETKKDFTHIGYLCTLERASNEGDPVAENLYEELLHHAHRGALPDDPDLRSEMVRVRTDLFRRASSFISQAMLPPPDLPDPDLPGEKDPARQPTKNGRLFDLSPGIGDQ